MKKKRVVYMVFHLTIWGIATYEPIKRDFNKPLQSSMKYGFPNNPIVIKPSQTNSKDKSHSKFNKFFSIGPKSKKWQTCTLPNQWIFDKANVKWGHHGYGGLWHGHIQSNKQTSILIYRLIIFHLIIFLILININCQSAYLWGQFFLPTL